MNNEDTISRAAAKESIAKRILGASDFAEDTRQACYDAIDAVPTVPPQVAHGRWIKDDSGVIYCSECGEEHEWEEYRAPYCDTCGAKMDGGEDDAAD